MKKKKNLFCKLKNNLYENKTLYSFLLYNYCTSEQVDTYTITAIGYSLTYLNCLLKTLFKVQENFLKIFEEVVIIQRQSVCSVF